MFPNDVRTALYTTQLGSRIYHYPLTDSTNRVAVALARAGEPEGTVVTADVQTQGRGRSDHVWHSTAGKDLLCSLILRPEREPHFVLPITLALSVAVSVCLSKALEIDILVKWPNDLLAPGGKIGGILAESSSGYVVAGIGVNVNSTRDDFPAGLGAASCLSETGRTHDRAALLADLLGTIETYYTRFKIDGFATLVSSYVDRLSVHRRRVRFEREGTWTAGCVDGVEADGALRVATDDGQVVQLYNETIAVEE